MSIRLCTPETCEHCHPWGDGVPGKVRCERDGKYVDGQGWETSPGWFTTTLGVECIHELRSRSHTGA